MKRNKVLASVLLSALFLQGTVAVSAAGKVASTANNEAAIEFEDNTDPTNPVDPENPTNPVDPKNPNEKTDNPGPLSIDLVSYYNFGKVKITGNDNTYFSAPTSVKPKGETEFVDRANYVQVTDNRGSGAGWKLTVEQQQPLHNATTNQDIVGTKITLLNGFSNNARKTDANTPVKGTDVVIEPGKGAVTVLTAQRDQGIGTWTHSFGKDATEGAKSVKLDIPGSQKISKGGYKATLKWTLLDDPS